MSDTCDDRSSREKRQAKENNGFATKDLGSGSRDRLEDSGKNLKGGYGPEALNVGRMNFSYYDLQLSDQPIAKRPEAMPRPIKRPNTYWQRDGERCCFYRSVEIPTTDSNERQNKSLAPRLIHCRNERREETD